MVKVIFMTVSDVGDAGRTRSRLYDMRAVVMSEVGHSHFVISTPPIAVAFLGQ